MSERPRRPATETLGGLGGWMSARMNRRAGDDEPEAEAGEPETAVPDDRPAGRAPRAAQPPARRPAPSGAETRRPARPERPRADRPERPRAERPRDDRPRAERPDRPERPRVERPRDERPERPREDRPERPRAERPGGPRPERAREDRPREGRPERPRPERPRPERDDRPDRSLPDRPAAAEREAPEPAADDAESWPEWLPPRQRHAVKDGVTEYRPVPRPPRTRRVVGENVSEYRPAPPAAGSPAGSRSSAADDGDAEPERPVRARESRDRPSRPERTGSGWAAGAAAMAAGGGAAEAVISAAGAGIAFEAAAKAAAAGKVAGAAGRVSLDKGGTRGATSTGGWRTRTGTGSWAGTGARVIPLRRSGDTGTQLALAPPPAPPPLLTPAETFAALDVRTQDRAVGGALLAATVVAAAVVELGLPAGLRSLAVFGYACLVPGIAAGRLLRLRDGLANFVIGLGLSVSFQLLLSYTLLTTKVFTTWGMWYINLAVGTVLIVVGIVVGERTGRPEGPGDDGRGDDDAYPPDPQPWGGAQEREPVRDGSR